MDTKLNQSRLSRDVSVKQPIKRRKSLFQFIQELKEELRKVSWTTQEELKFSTKIVVCSIFLFGLGIYLVDLFVKSGLDLVAFIFG